MFGYNDHTLSLMLSIKNIHDHFRSLWIQKEIAKKVGITQQRVQQIVNKLDIQQIYNLYFEKGD